ncbi:hypothetical protein [Cesiribacter andamanensis]|uniref:Tryptophan-rich sensory protein n=1 Tax=Cesiribacter andamanensis AMV16 TaxID=1279009 RepID=M7NGS2_9BACT|nr:hypothetical protein [Cesiribacter andamanensis]EMR01030.1 hypothetical protein ADICEAN_03842 [Cesiribacter andamanensis AMV16]
MKPIVLLLANTLSLLVTLAVNYGAGTGALTNTSIGEISDRYPTLLTPAGWAFSIWGLIYLLLILFTAYQWVAWKKGRTDESLKPAGIWFLLVNLANALWVVVWLNEWLGLSVLLIFLLLFCLIMLVLRLRLEVWDAPLRIILFVWWPICIYTGWITLASITNVSVWLKSLQWDPLLLSAGGWALLLVVVAGLLYLFLTWKRNMREAALVGVWGLSAIAYKQWNNAEAVAIICLVVALLVFLSAAYHGYKNRHASPFFS